MTSASPRAFRAIVPTFLPWRVSYESVPKKWRFLAAQTNLLSHRDRESWIGPGWGAASGGHTNEIQLRADDGLSRAIKWSTERFSARASRDGALTASVIESSRREGRVGMVYVHRPNRTVLEPCTDDFYWEELSGTWRNHSSDISLNFFRVCNPRRTLLGLLKWIYKYSIHII